MLLLLCIKSLYVSGLVWDLHLNFPPVLSSDVAIRTVVITQPCDGYSLALSCGSENVLILISLLSLMMFLVVLDDFLFFFWLCHTASGISGPYPEIELRSWQ